MSELAEGYLSIYHYVSVSELAEGYTNTDT